MTIYPQKKKKFIKRIIMERNREKPFARLDEREVRSELEGRSVGNGCVGRQANAEKILVISLVDDEISGVT